MGWTRAVEEHAGTRLFLVITRKKPADWRTDFLYQFKWSSEIIPASEGVCSKDWKYVRWVVSNTEELSDLKDDPIEGHNVAGDPANVTDLAHFRARLATLKKESAVLRSSS